MRKNLLKSFLFVALAAAGLSTYGQTNEEMRLAVDILKGKDTSNSKTWAVDILEQSLQRKRDAFALNVLSIAYLHGLGVEADTLKAIAYMEESGANGYKLAYHNLGMFYKYASDGKQDFKKAYEAFKKGALTGSESCCYDTGFMLYKGLGCQQDYAAAVALFRQAADRDHAPSLFMLGLCYRNGYGVERDAERAKFYLERAAKLNNQDAMEELLKDEPENNPKRRFVNVDKSMEIPETMPAIDPYIPHNRGAIAGTYQGVLVTYDWSGENVISEKPLAMNVTEKAGKYDGLWIQGKDSICFQATATDDGVLKFDSTQVVLYDRYSDDYKALYRFEQADISCGDNSISGQLRLYSLEEMEPERPMYVYLQKNGDADAQDEQSEDDNSKIYAYPNPFVDRVTLRFELEADVPSAQICLYSQAGINKQNYNLGALGAGEHSFVIAPDVSENIYIVRVVAGQYKYQTIIFRKR